MTPLLLATWVIAVLICVVLAVFALAVIHVIFSAARRQAERDIESEETEESETDPLPGALSLVLAHGDTMHTCGECQSQQTTLTDFGYRYNQDAASMVVLVHERCNDCGNEVRYMMTSIGWVCAVAHTEWTKWMLAQDSANVHLDITNDLGKLGPEGLDGPTS